MCSIGPAFLVVDFPIDTVLQCLERQSVINSVTISCSSLFFSSQASFDSDDGRVPASAIVEMNSPSLRRSSSGVAPIQVPVIVVENKKTKASGYAEQSTSKVASRSVGTSILMIRAATVLLLLSSSDRMISLTSSSNSSRGVEAGIADGSGNNFVRGLIISKGIVIIPSSGFANGAMTKPLANPFRSRSDPPDMTSVALGSLYLNLFTE